MLWKHVVFAETEEHHEQAWARLCEEFADQRPILMYLYRTYLPVRAQWARCFIRRYRNFGIRVTSGTEASNNNVKSYLLNGMSHLYRLVEAIQDLLQDQERDFIHACALDEVLITREDHGRGSEYLGELRTMVSQKGLRLVTREHRHALKAIPSGSNPWPEPVGACREDCTVSIELGIPCCHKIYAALESDTPLTKWEIHPRWHLRKPTSQDPYRRILDPKIATALRGRPRNTPQTVPANLAVRTGSQPQSSQRQIDQPRRGRGRPRGSRNKATLRRQHEASQEEGSLPAHRQKPSQDRQQKTASLGSGRTTGVRASGRRTQPSVRRRRSQWELLGDEETLRSRSKPSRRQAIALATLGAPEQNTEPGTYECITVAL
jgi:hypothetical protein